MGQRRSVILLLEDGLEIDTIKDEDVASRMTISSWNKTSYVWP